VCKHDLDVDVVDGIAFVSRDVLLGHEVAPERRAAQWPLSPHLAKHAKRGLLKGFQMPQRRVDGTLLTDASAA
jgi:hypothetical protein